MLFNSYVFIFLFLPVVLCGWWWLRGATTRLAFITLASYFFYGWWNWRFLPLMIASTTVDYIAGQKIAASNDRRTRKFWLAGSLGFNLAVLGFFKYYGFFSNSVNATLQYAGSPAHIPVLNIILPIGISFYTFNSMSYTIDIYRKVVRPVPSPLHFSAFVALFPHLIAGPIVRYSDIERQFANLKTRLSGEQAATGIFFLVTGLSKKVLLADRLGRGADLMFSAPYGVGAIAAWAGALSYTFQIYFDFSAYSDMAVGLAHLLGIQFPQNFDSPYKSINISDFWRRWHISFSSWLRDYLFIPLGGSRGSDARTLRNLAITMFLGGLWHGAQWTFVAWGLYHGLLLGGYAIMKQRGWTPDSILASRAITFILVVFGWVLFRATTFLGAAYVIGGMLGANGIGASREFAETYQIIAVAAAIAFLLPNTWQIKLKPRWCYAFVLAAAAMVAISTLGKESPFLYFQF